MGVAHDALPKSQTSSNFSMQVCVRVSFSSKLGCDVQVWPMPAAGYVREYRTEPPLGPLASKSKCPFETLDDFKSRIQFKSHPHDFIKP